MSNCFEDLYDYDLVKDVVNVELFHCRSIFVKLKLKTMFYIIIANHEGRNSILKIVIKFKNII